MGLLWLLLIFSWSNWLIYIFGNNFSQRSACTPNTSVELTPGPTKTEGNFMRVAGKLSELSISKPYGRRNTTSGWSAPRVSIWHFLAKFGLFHVPKTKIKSFNYSKVAQVVRRASRQEIRRPRLSRWCMYQTIRFHSNLIQIIPFYSYLIWKIPSNYRRRMVLQMLPLLMTTQRKRKKKRKR